MWDTINDSCDVCQCSRMINSAFQLSEQCCKDKENMQQPLGSPMKHDGDLSLNGNSSPARTSCDDSSPSRCAHQRSARRPLMDHDPNSQDSGYGASCPNEGEKFFQFAKSIGVTPALDCSPLKNPTMSFGSFDSMDDEFLELSDLEPIHDNVHLPTDFNKLVTGSLTSSIHNKRKSPDNDCHWRPPFRRALSLVDDNTPNSSRVRSCLFRGADETDFRPFKRPEPPTTAQSPLQIKRYKIVDEEMQIVVRPSSSRPLFQRSFSATEESIKTALHRSSTEPDLIGDFSKVFCLPLAPGRHKDLKSITASTLALLMRGQFDSSVASFKVIDCRYPYEYDGGHIDGAINIYTKEQVLENLLDNMENRPTQTNPCVKRQILVFHCEFSSERGPKLYRFLRNLDRSRNEESYPALHYPEIYLLEGGYKSFYEQFSNLCVPELYKPMMHPEHQDDLRHFRNKSKIWNGDRGRRNTGLKRLNFH